LPENFRAIALIFLELLKENLEGRGRIGKSLSRKSLSTKVGEPPHPKDISMKINLE